MLWWPRLHLLNDANQVESNRVEACSAETFMLKLCKAKRSKTVRQPRVYRTGVRDARCSIVLHAFLQAAASCLPCNNKRLHVERCNRSSSGFLLLFYLPPSPRSKHFPMPANFSRRVLICNSLGCFLRLHALLSRMHNLQHDVRVRAHINPNASQQGVGSYLILTYCSYWILCPHALLPSGTRSRRTKMFLLFTHRLITTDCAASLHCRHRCFLPPSPPGG